ncbi:transmembrane protein 132C isoform X2 [Zeugodacus cucurbitae]|uniref:transmembrane protein 132C isoform X2 n=1 Tax=Zeugodacus cucurbitae TaxID=28588 RepID=UPI0023D9129A|nr:transmembrane protein 132C isoform X2 [Zeugodacus cucurbitae]
MLNNSTSERKKKDATKTDLGLCVEVHFESAESGFFLKHTRQPPIAPEISIKSLNATSSKSHIHDSVLSIDRFTVVQTTQPVSIRASYGPFSTKQTVPARYIVPDVLDNQNSNLNNTTAALIELQQTNMHLDISAHLIKPTVSRDSPVLRVLFHAGTDPGGHLQRQRICVLLHISLGNQIPLKGRCMPEGEDNVCVAEVIIPSVWWPGYPLVTGSSRTSQKLPHRVMQASYSVFEPSPRNSEQCEPKVQIQPLTIFAHIPLVAASVQFKEIRIDEQLTLLLPQNTLYPMSKIYVPVIFHQTQDIAISSFTIRARVKAGIKILGATTSTDFWSISIEKENPKHTTARVTAYKKETEVSAEIINDMKNTSIDTSSVEVFSWLLELGDGVVDILDGGKIVWYVSYVNKPDKSKNQISSSTVADESKKRLTTKLEINKDDIQAVLPMAKNWELINTAVLTGRQVAQAMKVFIVSQAGKVADVTLQSSCYAEDESVIKVSSSCSSVYVDGSEIRGSSNASVVVKYGSYSGLAKFTVWMPEFPLEVYVSDFRLSQIKGWKVVDDSNIFPSKQNLHRKKRSTGWNQYKNDAGVDKVICKARYQQSPIEVFARFLAIDQNSGRISYFISRRTGLRVTDLVQPLLRISDPKIATLKGRILQGKSMGRTDIQVLSPITGRVIGTKEIRVGSDKVSLRRLIVRVISGLQLTISPDSTIDNGYTAETSVTNKLTAQYQEGLLDIDLEFSDGSKTPLRDISVEDYFLLVESLDTEVVAFAPMLASHHPRVIAVGEGSGDLLRVTLLLSEDCRMRRSVTSSKHVKSNFAPLISSLAAVEVDFNNFDNNNKLESIQNDGIVGKDRKNFRSNGDLADIIGIPLKNSLYNGDTLMVQTRQHHGSTQSLKNYRKSSFRNHMSSMEIGVYVLLTAFCFAIVVFVISCVVYASKFKPRTLDAGNGPLDLSKAIISPNILSKDLRFPKESTTNVHDWVWLGRSTMDRSSVVNDTTTNNRDSRIKITNNPINFIDSPATFFDGHQKNSQDVIPRTEFNSSNCCIKAVEYKPPVPPHRNIGVRALASFDNEEGMGVSNVGTEEREIDVSPSEMRIEKNGSQIQKDTHLIRKPLQQANYSEMHNAEKIVQFADYSRKTAFQFDSLPQNNKIDSVTEDCIIIEKKEIKTPTSITKEEKEGVKLLQLSSGINSVLKKDVKRATVVGNPMFSNTTSDDHIDSRDDLVLDGFEMDYEQIMHYFDNLKESNA